MVSAAIDRDALRERIRTAFSARTYPSDERLVLDDGGCAREDTLWVERFFRGKHWRDIDRDALLADGALDLTAFPFFMTAEAFVFFLPALLIAALDEEGPVLGELLAFRLTPPNEGAEAEPMRVEFERIVERLNPEERRVVAATFAALAELFDRSGYATNLAREALDAYWAADLEPGLP